MRLACTIRRNTTLYTLFVNCSRLTVVGSGGGDNRVYLVRDNSFLPDPLMPDLGWCIRRGLLGSAGGSWNHEEEVAAVAPGAAGG